MAQSLGFFGDGISFWVVFGQSFWQGSSWSACIAQPRWRPAKILGGGRTCGISFWPFPNSSASVSSVQFSHSVMSNSLWPHEPQHTRPPCPSPTPRVYPNSCLLSRWCHLTISSSNVPFSSYLQSFPASGSFQMSQLSASDGQNIGVSASASVLPVNTSVVAYYFCVP